MPLCGRDQDFAVFLQSLFIDGDLDGVSSESIESVDQNDIPFFGSIAVG